MGGWGGIGWGGGGVLLCFLWQSVSCDRCGSRELLGSDTCVCVGNCEVLTPGGGGGDCEELTPVGVENCEVVTPVVVKNCETLR